MHLQPECLHWLTVRMQTAVPEIASVDQESEATQKLYGLDSTNEYQKYYALQCLRARRLVEADVRFVEITCPLTHANNSPWDQHGTLPKDLPNQCRDVDQPSAGLLTDLRQRGMLDDTLVVWGGEFGRTIYCQGKLTKTDYGRDHHPKCFSIWLAGGGIQGGVVHGETDDFSYNITKDPVHIRDLNATILHLMGIDHERFTYPFKGLDQRLTGVEECRIVNQILV